MFATVNQIQLRIAGLIQALQPQPRLRLLLTPGNRNNKQREDKADSLDTTHHIRIDHPKNESIITSTLCLRHSLPTGPKLSLWGTHIVLI
jgi:hypothetical protein